MKKIKKWQIIVFGALVGVINGFFGGGGGMIVVPLLNKMFGLEQKKAQATALFVILPISLVSTIVYMCHKSIAFVSGWPVILGIVGGGVIGATLLNKLNNKVVKYIFIIFMLLGGIGMLIW
ncbi:MAG: sulfite exporter TauE/SafE family protein [Clostridia bacterium]|nr:sulfite exporter TauE/SafE family protein [Clostridia bacterium]